MDKYKSSLFTSLLVKLYNLFSCIIDGEKEIWTYKSKIKNLKIKRESKLFWIAYKYYLEICYLISFIKSNQAKNFDLAMLSKNLIFN